MKRCARKIDGGRVLLPGSRDERLAAVIAIVLLASQPVLVATTLGLTHHNAETMRVVMPMILGLALPTGLLLLAGPRLVRLPPTPFAWALLIGVGLVLRLLWLGKTPPLDDDFFRYLWDGALVANALDPYRHAPADFLGANVGTATHAALAARARDIIANTNFNDLRTIYPSVAQAAFALAHLIAPFKVDGLRLVFIAGEIATLVLLARLLAETGRSPFWAALYWWNPFAATMVIGLVHVDALIPPLVLGALLAQLRGRPMLALMLVGLGAGVKVWPLMLAPILLWPLLREPRRLITGCLVLGATLAVAIGPVLLSALRPGSGFSAYTAGWSNNNAFYAWTVHGLRFGLGFGDGAERMLRLALAVTTGLIALAQAVRGDTSLPSMVQRFMIVAAAVFYLAPAQFPWYAVWFLPLAALAGCWPLLLASVLLPAYFLFYPHWPVERGALFFYALAFIHSVPVLGWLLYDWYRAQPRAAAAP